MARREVTPLDEIGAGDELVDIIKGFYADPLGFVYFAFAWGEEGTDLAGEEGPDFWQEQVLLEIGRRVQEGVDAGEAVAEAVQVAVASGHGIGKTALIAWIILWFISTRDHPQIVVTANTKAQLTSKTWRELAKWQKRAINGSWFQWSAEKFYLKGHSETWFASAVPWTKEKAEAFAGTHEKHVLLVFDEGSAIDDAIWEVAEGAMTTAGAMWIVFGNPTRNTGRFRECWRRFAKRWFTMQVDSRDAKKASKKQIQAWLEDYGEDSDFFRVRVKGQWPRAATSQFISEEDVAAAVARFKRRERLKREKALLLNIDPERVSLAVTDDVDPDEPLVLAVDVARYGDDHTVLLLRKGDIAKIIGRYNGLGTDQVKQLVIDAITEHRPDATFVDGVGVGAGVVDELRALGYSVIDVNAGRKALNPKAYFNRRVEMYDRVRKWLRGGGCIEETRTLTEGLTAVEYGFADRSGQLQLESKDDMKARGLPSPDEADALAMTFYETVARRQSRDDAMRRKVDRLTAILQQTTHMSA
ncbi:terminase large subunit domain-containing protein [Falsiroseomonas tokyonensis]|uniref:Terminase large subunit domain-containing protein n=1 Tax=Falsiroseomonas tokyonensis TaxID=430521 RepID=A0ABV7C1K8_9PROT|nr:terminase family protein [Falsiroseomonas tokyonensis]MBU8540191.1 terminase family protein [Falsiroseomonas tokyonensis]